MKIECCFRCGHNIPLRVFGDRCRHCGDWMLDADPALPFPLAIRRVAAIERRDGSQIRSVRQLRRHAGVLVREGIARNFRHALATRAYGQGIRIVWGKA